MDLKSAQTTRSFQCVKAGVIYYLLISMNASSCRLCADFDRTPGPLRNEERIDAGQNLPSQMLYRI